MAGGAPETGRSIFVTAPDGLRLHVREYGARGAPGLAVVCLPALSRTVADFETLATFLAYGSAPPPGPRLRAPECKLVAEGLGVGVERRGDSAPDQTPPLPHPPPQGERESSRRVIAIDARGRGQSDYDRNPENYNLRVELADVFAVLVALAIGPAVFIGSSRGGLLALQLGVAHPTVIAGVVLNDIGPVIEPKGLARIKSYVGKLPQPRSFEEGAEILRRLFAGQFPKLTAEQWLAAARRAWRLQNGALRPTYDVRLARTLADIDIERPLPPLWNEFEALSRVPILVIRGEKSDILSAATVAEMAARHAGLQSIEVADQGHVPLLEGEELVGRIAEFVAACDRAASRGASEANGKAPLESRTTAAKRWGDRWP